MWEPIVAGACLLMGAISLVEIASLLWARRTAEHPGVVRLEPSPEWNAYMTARGRHMLRPTRELRAAYCAAFHVEETFLLRRDLAEALAQHEAWGRAEPSTVPMVPLPPVVGAE